jgi:hypothetical protein
VTDEEVELARRSYVYWDGDRALADLELKWLVVPQA